MMEEGGGPLDLESLTKAIRRLPIAKGEARNALTLSTARLHIARGPRGDIELFIEGNRESFGHVVVGHALEFGTYRELRGEREFSAVVVRAGSDDVWIRPIAHIAYEAQHYLLIHPAASNEHLLNHLAPYLEIVSARNILSIDHQTGLTAELLFLDSVLNAAEELRATPEAAVSSWTGWDSASRDFKGAGVAVEVKASRGSKRAHWVHPMYQLLADPAGDPEEVYVLSVGLQTDRSRSFKLLTMVDRLLQRLSGVAADALVDNLAAYGGRQGFNLSQRRQYDLEPGFLVTLPPTLYRVDSLRGILRPESFSHGTLPGRVSDIRYRVNLEGVPPASDVERRRVLRALLLK